MNARAVTPDGRLAVARAADGSLSLFPIEGGVPRPVPGARPGDLSIRWTLDGRGLYVHGADSLPARIDLLEVATGKRRPFREITPLEPAGVVTVQPIFMSADGSAHIYSYRRVLDSLFVVSGVK
jgi:hypothetical protein